MVIALGSCSRAKSRLARSPARGLSPLDGVRVAARLRPGARHPRGCGHTLAELPE
jgi:hypothetical protein